MIMKDCRYPVFFPGILENEEKKFNVDTNAYYTTKNYTLKIFLSVNRYMVQMHHVWFPEIKCRTFFLMILTELWFLFYLKKLKWQLNRLFGKWQIH